MHHVSRRKALWFSSLYSSDYCVILQSTMRWATLCFLTLRLFMQCQHSPCFRLTADLSSELLTSVGTRRNDQETSGLAHDRLIQEPLNPMAVAIDFLRINCGKSLPWLTGLCGVSCRCRCHESWREVHHDLRGAVPEVFEGCPWRWNFSSGTASYLSPPFGCTLMIWLKTKRNKMWVALTT